MNTRTVNVRVDAANPELELKPHMFVNAVVQVEVDNAGNVINSDWVGKYICPFHPERSQFRPWNLPREQTASYNLQAHTDTLRRDIPSCLW